MNLFNQKQDKINITNHKKKQTFNIKQSTYIYIYIERERDRDAYIKEERWMKEKR